MASMLKGQEAHAIAEATSGTAPNNIEEVLKKAHGELEDASQESVQKTLNEVPEDTSPESIPTTPQKTDGEAEDSSLDGYASVAPNSANGNGVSTDSVKRETVLKAGMKCNAVDFYMSKEGFWTKTRPENVEEAPENNETALAAILKRNSKSIDTRKMFSLHAIIIQSPFIKRVLSSVFRNYEGITSELGRLQFEHPFEAFVHRWEKFQAARWSEGDIDTRNHLDLLYDILIEELQPILETRDDFLKHGVITYDYIWTMFEPGTLVFKQKEDSERVMRVQSYEYNHADNVFCISNHFVEWTGTKFGMEDESFKIKKFAGTKRIIDLPSFPLIYHPETINLQKRCIARGKLWESHCTYLYKAYKGIGTSSAGLIYSVDSRVVLDSAAFEEFNPNSKISVYELDDDDSYHPPPSDDEECGSLISLTPYQYLLATDTLRGYSLKDKVWLTLSLSGIKEISWNEKAFPSLVLPDDTKDLILAFAQSQLKRKQTFDDIIEGKGKGIILLLSGPPGVGKTLTAEACSEAMRVPLYVVSAGDLGTEPWQVEETLKHILKMTTKWKAILLLDEADVFLEARSIHDLGRNKLVSIFLRILEYFEGFLFLTSNRVDNIDSAFESRIHLSLQYGGLSFASRRQVWGSFLKQHLAKKRFTDEHLNALAGIELNGRQIKNIIKTAQLLATSKNQPLCYEHVQVIAKLRAQHACVPLRSN